MSAANLLSHLRVIDLTDDLGRYAGRLLADLGAQVTRIVATEDASARVSALAWDHGKQIVALDIDAQEGRERLHQLILGADVLIRNDASRPFAHDALAGAHPGLIDVVVTPFSASGELRDRPASDLTLMARSGLMTIIGDPDRAPMTLPGEQSYALAGAQGAVAVLTALHARHLDGKGQLVTVSALQSTVLANYREPLVWQFAGRIGRRTGNLLVRGKSGVRQIWSCRNGYVTWSLVDNPGMMRGMVEVMREFDAAGELAEVDWEGTLVADTPRETLARWEQRIEAFFDAHTREQLTAWSVERGLGLSPIDELDDVLASEQLRERGLWHTLDEPKISVPGPMFLASKFEPGEGAS